MGDIVYYQIKENHMCDITRIDMLHNSELTIWYGIRNIESTMLETLYEEVETL